MKLTDEKILVLASTWGIGAAGRVMWEPFVISFARAILREAGTEELERDAERLNWVASRGAHVSWSRDGELCNVWLPAEDEEDARPAEGYPQKCYDSPREAIDQAMKAK